MDEELMAIRQELLKTLFVVSEAGKLEEYIRHAARMHTRLAVRKGEVKGNVIHAAPIFNFCSYVREIAWRALPDGKAMNLTRPQIEAAWGEPQDWYYFSGMKKPAEDQLPDAT
jgi:hypothetical protein